LGTSSVKALCVYPDGRTVHAGKAYPKRDADGWRRTLLSLLSEMDLTDVYAVGLSSQVGTYMIEGVPEPIHWYDNVGDAECMAWRAGDTPETFVREIGMPHPLIRSYPLPRIRYILDTYGADFEGHPRRICQPKDYLCRLLTGNWVTDTCSMRGLAHPDGFYSRYFMDKLGITQDHIPPLIEPDGLVGGITSEIAAVTGLAKDTPVYCGCNDFYTGMLGLGVGNTGEAFDVTGTSEHIGILQDSIDPCTDLVVSPYLKTNVLYGVTASSGSSLSFAIRSYGMDVIESLQKTYPDAPLFLPYVGGERAPIWDGDAKGVYFGIGTDCSKEELAYSVLEGVAFSIYHIYEGMNGNAEKMLVGGGASEDPFLNKLKASLFGIPVVSTREKESSALGGAMWAALGSGLSADVHDAIRTYVKPDQVFMPENEWTETLRRRFAVYKTLYPAMKDSFQRWKKRYD
ncbi:MAG: hypothetical protein IJX14_02675, partial [Clostridia bacterium]|nr:hypothetical protein [Clostridia bacterium]